MEERSRSGRPKTIAPKQLAAFRLPPALLDRIDRYAERLHREAPWSNATRADAVRALLVLALDALEGSPAQTAQVE